MKANITMISDLEQKLKQDGQAIQKLAQSRLDQLDVNQSLIQAIEADRVSSRKTVTNTWWYGLAAAISLTVMIWAISSTDSTQMNQPHQAQQQKVQIAVQLNFKQLPLSLEQKINQPLLDEQQAIIQDLKTLKAQLLSI